MSFEVRGGGGGGMIKQERGRTTHPKDGRVEHHDKHKKQLSVGSSMNGD